MSAEMNTANVKPAGNARMRYLFLFLLGLALGVLATIMVLRAWQARQDPYPDSVMHVMAAHLDALGNNVKQNHCAATDTLPHLQTLRLVSNDIEVAFADEFDDPRFAEHASDLRAALDDALSSPPLNCPGVGTTVKQIGGKCKACHEDFRG